MRKQNRATIVLLTAIISVPTMAQTDQQLLVDTPCFDANIEVPLEYVLEMRGFNNGEMVTLDRSGYPNAITNKFCGLGAWVIETRVGKECIEWIGYRRVTGIPCDWGEWILTVTATVEKRTIPRPPFLVKISPVRDSISAIAVFKWLQ